MCVCVCKRPQTFLFYPQFPWYPMVGKPLEQLAGLQTNQPRDAGLGSRTAHGPGPEPPWAHWVAEATQVILGDLR